ncbi:MAG TPA: helix-turn-helix domain-containing protein [Terracidiphilus sp.]|nr:helix-turn-helix domain-containing protein [Terracidiphilus sp.]
MAKESIPEHRSGCPVSVSLEVLGDRWSLLIVRDMMVRGYRTFREFQHAGEGIASNILADRLRKLEAAGILTTEPAAQDRRSAYYRLTAKGIALAPVLLDLLIWGSRHEATAAPCSVIAQMEQNREAVLAEAFRRWEQRDTTPLIPPFNSPITSAGDTSEARRAPRSRRLRKERSSPMTTMQAKSSPKGKMKR